MDIDYLLWLQGLREAMPPFVEHAFVLASDLLGASVLTLLIPFLVIWLVDRPRGLRYLTAFATGVAATQLIKCVVCVPRPWVLDGRVKPVDKALTHATGYSFPSGHTTSATSVFGTASIEAQHPLLKVLAIVAVVVVGFSRNLLGVHTPQDVAVGFIFGVVGIMCAQLLVGWVEKLSARGRCGFGLCVLVLCAVALAFISLKSYPASSSAADILEMLDDGYQSIGLIAGLGLVAMLPQPKELAAAQLPERLARLAIGAFICGFAYAVIGEGAKIALGQLWGVFVRAALTAVCAAAIVPYCFEPLQRLMYKEERS